MSDNELKTNAISKAYERFANEDLAVSIDPASLTSDHAEEICTSQAPGDHYENYDASQDLLTFATAVPLSQPERFGNKTHMSISQLVKAAGSKNLTRAKHAQEELRTVLRDQIAPNANQAQDMSHRDPDEGLVNALALMSTPGDSPEAVQRRLDGVEILRLLLEANEGDTDFLRGIMVVAAEINNPESIHLVAELADQNRQVFQEIHDLPNRQEVQQEIAQTRSKSLVAQGNAPTGGGAVEKSMAATTEAPGLVALAGNAATLPVDTTNLVSQVLDTHLGRSNAARYLLTTGPGKALENRLSEVLGDSRLTTSQRFPGLYYAVLGKAFAHPELNSTDPQYGELRPVANGIARDVLRSVGLEDAIPSFSPAGIQDSASAGVELKGAKVLAATQGSGSKRMASASNGFGLDSSLGIFTGEGSPAVPFLPGLQPTSSTAAAGMMGINFLALAGRPGMDSVGWGTSDEPDYFVKGLDSAEADSHSGSQGGFSGDGEESGSKSSSDAYV